MKQLVKGTPYGMCKHVENSESEFVHWYVLATQPKSKRRLPQYAMVALCPTCFTAAEKNPSAPLPVTAHDVLEEDLSLES